MVLSFHLQRLLRDEEKRLQLRLNRKVRMKFPYKTLFYESLKAQSKLLEGTADGGDSRIPDETKRIADCEEITNNTDAYLKAVRSAYVASYRDDVAGKVLKTMCVTPSLSVPPMFHTSEYQGNTDTYILWHADGGRMQVYKFPEFRCCVVLYRGREYIPLSYSESTLTLRVCGCDIDNEDVAKEFDIPNMDKDLSELERVGKFDNIVVVGALQNGLVQITTTQTGTIRKTIQSPTELSQVKFSYLVTMARDPSNLFVTYGTGHRYTIEGKKDSWSKFPGWKYRHGHPASGPRNTADCAHTIVFFQQICQDPELENSNAPTSGKCDYTSAEEETSKMNVSMESPDIVAMSERDCNALYSETDERAQIG